MAEIILWPIIIRKHPLTPRASLKSMAAWAGSKHASDALWGIAGAPRDNLRAVGSNEPLLSAPERSKLIYMYHI